MADGAQDQRQPPTWFLGALVVALAVAGYSAALHGSGFTLDDELVIRDNPLLELRSVEDLWTLLTWPYFGAPLWRPLTVLSFAVDRALFGIDPDASHGVNVALHALVSLGTFLLGWRLLRARAPALFAAALFAMHPVHAEAVAGGVGRAEVLALGLALLGFLAHLRGRRSGPGYFVLAGLAFLAGFGCKETALTAPFVLPLIELAARGPARPSRPGGSAALASIQPWSAWRVAAPYLGYLALVLAFLAARTWVLGPSLPPPAGDIAGRPLGERILIAAWVGVDSWQDLLVPSSTSAIFPLDAATVWTDPRGWAHLLVNAAVLGTGTWLLARGARGRGGLVFGLGLVGFYLTLGPVSGLIPIGVVRADRLLYTPSFYACLAGAAAVAEARRRLPTASALRALTWPALTLVLLSVYAWRLQSNVAAWTDRDQLWATSLERFPEEPRILVYRAELLMNRGEFARAEAVLSLAARSPSQPARTRARLATAVFEQGRLEEAERLLRPLWEARPSDEHVAPALVRLELRRSSRATSLQLATAAAQDAVAVADRALAAGAPAAELLRLRAMALLRLPGREADALRDLDQALRRDSEGWLVRTQRAVVRRQVGDRVGALDDLLASADELLARSPLLPVERRVLEGALLEAAELALDLGRPEVARAQLDRLEGIGPPSDPARIGRVRDALVQGDSARGAAKNGR